MKGEHELVYMPELQRRLEFRGDKRGRALRDELLRREKRSGKKFITRIQGPKHVRYKCTVAAVRRYARDLIPESTEALLSEVRECLDSVEERAASAARNVIDQSVRPQLERLDNLQNTSARAMKRLSGGFDRLEQRVTSLESANERQ